MLLMAVRIGEQRKAKYAKVLEHIGGCHEAQEVPFGDLSVASINYWGGLKLLGGPNPTSGHLGSSIRSARIIL